MAKRARMVVAAAVLLGTGLVGIAHAEDIHRKVRGADAKSEALIGSARRASRTVADLLSALEQSDLVVMVQVTLIDDALGGDTRLLAATDSYRYLLLRVHSAISPPAQIESLGHELQHAVEVAAATDVRDQAGLVRLLERIGRKTGRGTFETDAAIRVSRRIHDEIAGAHRKF